MKGSVYNEETCVSLVENVNPTHNLLFDTETKTIIWVDTNTNLISHERELSGLTFNPTMEVEFDSVGCIHLVSISVEEVAYKILFNTSSKKLIWVNSKTNSIVQERSVAI